MLIYQGVSPESDEKKPISQSLYVALVTIGLVHQLPQLPADSRDVRSWSNWPRNMVQLWPFTTYKSVSHPVYMEW